MPRLRIEQLTPLARTVFEHWQEHLPRALLRLEAQGNALQVMEGIAEQAALMQTQLIQNGTPPDAAREMVSRELIHIPPTRARQAERDALASTTA